MTVHAVWRFSDKEKEFVKFPPKVYLCSKCSCGQGQKCSCDDYRHTFALTTLTPARPPKPTPMPPPHEELRWAKRGVSPTTNNKVSANIHSTHYMHLFYARRRCAHLVWMPLSCPSLSFAVHRREVTYNGARIGAHVDSRGEMTKCEVAVRLVPSGPLPFRHGGRAAALIVLSWSAAIDSKTAPSFTLTDSTADPQ